MSGAMYSQKAEDYQNRRQARLEEERAVRKRLAEIESGIEAREAKRGVLGRREAALETELYATSGVQRASVSLELERIGQAKEAAEAELDRLQGEAAPLRAELAQIQADLTQLRTEFVAEIERIERNGGRAQMRAQLMAMQMELHQDTLARLNLIHERLDETYSLMQRNQARIEALERRTRPLHWYVLGRVLVIEGLTRLAAAAWLWLEVRQALLAQAPLSVGLAAAVVVVAVWLANDVWHYVR